MPNSKTTDPQNELLIEVNSKNEIIGSIPRGIAHKSPEKFYRTIYVVVKNDKDEILFQKRSSTKDLFPDCWDLSVGGHVDFGKGYIETAVRELREELDFIVTEEELKFLGEVLVKLPSSNEFFNVFEYNLKSTDKVDILEDEVSETVWMTMTQVKESMKEGTLKWYPRPLQVVKALF